LDMAAYATDVPPSLMPAPGTNEQPERAPAPATDEGPATNLETAPTSPQDDDRACRICLDTESEEDNPLISPCRCSGSMRFVHRACLDEWRISCFNPKALVSCTTCQTPFRTRYEGPGEEPTGRRWWVRFAKDVAWYAGVRIAAIITASIALGFWPHLLLGAGVGALHPNPLIAHLLCGTGTVFAIAGTVAVLQLPGMWHTGEGVRLLFDAWCPRRGGGKGSGMETLVAILVIVGLLVCLFFLLRGIWRMFDEGRHEVARAVRGANQTVRRQVVKDFVVLDYEENTSAPSPSPPVDTPAVEDGSPARQTTEDAAAERDLGRVKVDPAPAENTLAPAPAPAPLSAAAAPADTPVRGNSEGTAAAKVLPETRQAETLDSTTVERRQAQLADAGTEERQCQPLEDDWLIM